MVHLVKVPALMLLVVNGDIFCTGSSWTDGNNAFMCAKDSTRYCVHLVKKGYSLSNGILYLRESKPMFMQPSSTSQKDPDALVQAVRGQSSVVKEAGTKTPVATRRADEPEPESLAPLTQPVYCVTSTRRAACCYRKKVNSRKGTHSFV